MADSKLTALVVDDEEIIRSLLTRVLSKVGYLVQTAENGKEAYDLIKKQKLDTLCIDLEMPGIDGDVFLEKLTSEILVIGKDKIKGYKIPTFFISANLSAPIDDNVARAVFYSHRMYTEEQIAKLGLPICQDMKAQRELLEKIAYSKNPDFGFTAIRKPFDVKDVLERTEKVYNMLTAER